MNESLVMLKKVGIPIPEQRLNEYPFQLSGGMRQRVMIAIALACNPKLLIADEPTTALDVSIQAQILELINNLKKEYGMSIMIITHDLGVIAEICDRVAVMYGGKIMEYTKVNTIFDKPLHPYTLGLLNSIPKLDQKIDRLKTIPGNVPCSLNITNGCKFHTRCHFANEKCRNEEPKIKEVGKDHKVRCWHYQKLYQQME
jgi:peptide/nickel transport system ATP-binding protein/oligopeptide transport system ATP-binding protein